MQYAKVIERISGKDGKPDEEAELGHFDFLVEPKKGDTIVFNQKKYFLLSREHRFEDIANSPKQKRSSNPERGVARENDFVLIVTEIKV